MENLTPRVTAALVLALMLAGGSLLAAQPNDFYISLLNRGVANANAGNNAAAIPELRIAAFGLVDNVPAFALAESYLAVVAQRLKLEAEARHAVQRLVAAERIEPTYARLPLSTAVRAELEKIARALLPPEQLALLHGTAPARGTVPPPAPVIATPDPQSVPATAQPAPAPRTLESTPTPAPQPPIVTPTPRPIPVTAPAPQPTPATPDPQPAPAAAPTPQPPIVTLTPQPTPAPVPVLQPAPATPDVQPAPAVAPPPVPQPRAVAPTPTPQPTPAPVPTSQPASATRNPQPATLSAPAPPPAPAPLPVPDRTATANALRREQERMATERRIEERAAELERNAPPPATAASAPADLKARLAAADAALAGGDLGAARAAYAELVEVPNLDRASALHLGESLYEAGDHRNAVRAFQRVGTFRAGEEPQRYTFALALYETGSYRAAKRELAAALPKLEQTAELQRNRAKIEGAID